MRVDTCTGILGGDFVSRGGWPAEGGLCVLLLRCDRVGAVYGHKSNLVLVLLVDAKFCFGDLWFWCARRALKTRRAFMYVNKYKEDFFERYCMGCSHTSPGEANWFA